MGSRESRATDRLAAGEESESVFTVSYGPQHPVPDERNESVAKPIGNYRKGQFVFTELANGYEGRSLPLPGSDVEIDQRVVAAQAGAAEALGRVIDLDLAVEDVLSRQGDN